MSVSERTFVVGCLHQLLRILLCGMDINRRQINVLPFAVRDILVPD